MDELKFAGVISHVSETKSYTNRDGNEKRFRELVITTDEQYPKSLVVTIKRESMLTLPLTKGQSITAYLSPRTFESKDGRIYNDIEAWRIDF